MNFVFHGGSGSTREEIREAVSYGVVKMNLDTDIQWAFWDGVRGYEAKNHDYLQGQIGNLKAPTLPNKSSTIRVCGSAPPRNPRPNASSCPSKISITSTATGLEARSPK